MYQLSPMAKRVAIDNMIRIVNNKLHLHLDAGCVDDRNRVFAMASALGVRIYPDGSIYSEAVLAGEV